MDGDEEMESVERNTAAKNEQKDENLSRPPTFKEFKGMFVRLNRFQMRKGE